MTTGDPNTANNQTVHRRSGLSILGHHNVNRPIAVTVNVLAGSESYSYSGRSRYSYPYSKRRTDADPIFDCGRLDADRYRVDLAVPSSGVDAEMLDGAFRRFCARPERSRLRKSMNRTVISSLRAKTSRTPEQSRPPKRPNECFSNTN
jgi:hypothetical protein